MKLDRSLSQVPSSEIVLELIRNLGEARTIEVLEVKPTRLNALINRKGRLADAQLARITESTGIAWQKWGIEAGARHAKTAKARAFVAATRAMWDQMELAEKPDLAHYKPTRTRRGATARQRQAV